MFQQFQIPELRPIPWKDFVTELMKEYEPPIKSPATRKGMAHALRTVGALGITSTEGLTSGLIAELVKTYAPGRSPNTVRTLLRYVQAACFQAYARGYVRMTPFFGRGLSAWMRPSRPRHKKHHSIEDIKAVLGLMAKQAAEAEGWAQWRARRLHALTATLCYTGVRASEAYYLKVTDIDLEHGIIWIRPHAEHQLKTDAAEAPIPMAPALKPILADWLAHRLDSPPGFEIDQKCEWAFPNTFRSSPWTSGSRGAKPRDRMKAVAAQAGVVGFTPLSCRHSLATHLKTAFNQGEGFVKRMLRHTSLQTQAWYTHDDLPNLRAGVSGVQF
jgi:integrase